MGCIFRFYMVKYIYISELPLKPIVLNSQHFVIQPKEMQAFLSNVSTLSARCVNSMLTMRMRKY